MKQVTAPTPQREVPAEPGSRTPGTSNDAEDIVAIPLRHPWRWVVAALLLASFVALAISLWINPNIDHPTITNYIFNPRIINGVGLTILMTVVAMVISTILGVLLAIMRLSTTR